MSHPGGHEGCSCCSEGGSEDPLEMGIQYSLYKRIDLENLECLNEEEDGSGKTVFKPYESKLDTSQFVQSDSDEELLFNIPFTGNVKLKNIRIAGGDDDSHPKMVKLYKNRPKMAFDDTSVKADQELQLTKDPTASLEYPVKTAIFSGIHHLSLYFPSNFGNDKTKIYYIGLRGEYTEAHHHGVTICNYEIRPNIHDHECKTYDPTNFTIQ
ncbi:unnamed protein product [Hermetia illucens]|uniref:PITH domain-containing protein n=1 Tax=Hermetia illucens TaxID=343691 RepID=A0A7R8YMM7_HERIL|nr:PITH domain-containing protein GA19395 [Hermetia illucens]CAD7078801.1 unnamed protein product [Hermetia illucens]